MPSVGPQRSLQLDAGRHDRRRQAEQEHRDSRDPDGPGQRRRIQVNLVEAGHSSRRERDEALECSGGHDDPERAAGDGEDPVLDQQLDNEPPAPGAQRGAHGDLPEAPHAADKQQTGDVDARDQQEQSRGGGKHEQCRPNVSEDEPRQRLHDTAQVALPRGRVGAAEEGGQLGSGFGDRCSRCEPPDHVERDKLQAVRRNRRRDRRPEVGASRIIESLRHHADNGVRHTILVHHDLPSQHMGIAAEPPLPGAIAQHHHRRRAVHIIRRLQGSAEHGSRAEHVEELTRNERAAQARDLIGVANR